MMQNETHTICMATQGELWNRATLTKQSKEKNQSMTRKYWNVVFIRTLGIFFSEVLHVCYRTVSCRTAVEQRNKSHLFICNAEQRRNNPQRPTSKCKKCLMMWEKSQLSPSSSVCILEENNPQFILQGSEAVSSERRRRLIKVMVEGDPSILFASSSPPPFATTWFDFEEEQNTFLWAWRQNKLFENVIASPARWQTHSALDC